MRLFLPLLLLPLLSVKICASSQAITMNPDKRIKAVIAGDSMNRIAVTNDRITQIFGDNEAYEVQSEENTGQLFLKPTSENGKKPLSVTLITENGATQDMTLQPADCEAATVILKNDTTVIDATGGLGAFPSQSYIAQSSIAQNLPQTLGGGAPGFGVALGFQDQIIVAMKYLVSGAAPVLDIDGVNRKSLKGIEVDFMQAFNLGAFKGLKLHVQNTTDVAMDVLEKDFLHTNDLALSFEKRVLPPKSETILYIVVR